MTPSRLLGPRPCVSSCVLKCVLLTAAQRRTGARRARRCVVLTFASSASDHEQGGNATQLSAVQAETFRQAKVATSALRPRQTVCDHLETYYNARVNMCNCIHVWLRHYRSATLALGFAKMYLFWKYLHLFHIVSEAFAWKMYFINIKW